MRKKIFGKQLQRDTKERKALFNSLMSALIIDESIKTTEAKAKAVKGEIEKIVTKAKKGEAYAEQFLQRYFTAEVLKKLVTDVAPRFTNRQGGYTRIIRVGHRVRDNANMVILEWVEKKEKIEIVTKGAKNASSKGTEIIDAEVVTKKESSSAKATDDKKKSKKSNKK